MSARNYAMSNGGRGQTYRNLTWSTVHQMFGGKKNYSFDKWLMGILQKLYWYLTDALGV